MESPKAKLYKGATTAYLKYFINNIGIGEEKVVSTIKLYNGIQSAIKNKEKEKKTVFVRAMKNINKNPK